MRKLLFIVNTPEFFLSHRLPIAISAQAAGFEVHVATGDGDGISKIVKVGLAHHKVELTRKGQNPVNEIKTFIQIFRLLSRIQPSLVHLVTIKPVIYGGIAARLANVSGVVAAVSGLGTVFTKNGVLGRTRRKLILILYKAALYHKNLAVIFQNPDDRDGLLAISALRKDQVRMIRGSGVNLANYSFVPEPEGTPVVVMAARLLRDKGVYEFVEAARLLKTRGVDVVMRLIGAPDPGNPTSVVQSELDNWSMEGVVELLGFRSDIADLYAAANIVCLPSYYGEGLPKTLVEAAACGRAVITTNHPGCRDAIESGATGVLVPVKNAPALADAIQILIETPERRLRMGRAGRELAEQAFSIDRIVEQHLAIYKELLGDA